MNVIELSDIGKYYGSQDSQIWALKNITLSIERGDFVAIVGQSGSGKSTLMNIIGCLDLPSIGSYKINGEDVAADKDKRAMLRCKTFGFIFQRYNLLSDLSAKENIVLPSIYYGQNAKTSDEKSSKLLNDLGLSDRANNRPNELSGGQQQRVSVARALMNGAEIILADEPTGALDSKNGEIVMDIINDLHKSGRTIILVTHDHKIASRANRIVEIKDGAIASDIRERSNIYETEAIKAVKPANSFSYMARRLAENMRSSLKTLAAHKTRSLLTALSIIIGIASVVTIIALGNGAKEQIMGRVKSIGAANTITIFPGKGFGDKDAGKITTLKLADAEILSRLSYVEGVNPLIADEGLTTYKNITVRSSLQGVSADFLALNNKKLQSGRNFSAAEIKDAAATVIIDINVQRALFGDRNSLGEIIVFNKHSLRIIGTLAEEDVFGPPSSNLEIYVPYATAMYKITGSRDLLGITVQISDDINSILAEDSLTKVLTSAHGSKDFFTLNGNSVRKLVESMTDSLTLLISSIAFISLVVGGVGVMNIMLASVVERTREIGVRMAIGAKRKDILRQFLTEAVLLALIGGCIGIALSLALALIFNGFSTDFKISPSIGATLGALTFSSALGMLFGYMPARRAANLNPIDALASD
ncbi:MAG: ATP-binding cassette domain-containing protein [Helicobacteraceae bacterium]|jgi:macrolide transport system ATP-binding/permease protein|nr:ATP-binding cassette domain-containing protein [Helicobacteraceae bacterium]